MVKVKIPACVKPLTRTPAQAHEEDMGFSLILASISSRTFRACEVDIRVNADKRVAGVRWADILTKELSETLNAVFVYDKGMRMCMSVCVSHGSSENEGMSLKFWR